MSVTEADRAFVNARPRFRIDDSLRSDLEAALLEMHVRRPLSGQASAELRFVNWRAADADGEADFAFQAIELGQRIEVLAGGDETLFAGEVTALEERHGEGAPQLVVLAEDSLHRLARRRANRSFANKSLSDVLEQVGGETGLHVDASVPPLQSTWHQINESNLAFLLRILAPCDLALRVIDNDRLRIKPEEPDTAPVVLHTQGNVRRLRIIADLNHQPRKAVIQGYDLGAGQAVHATAESLQPAPSGETARESLKHQSWGQAEVFPEPFAANQSAANAWARGRFEHAGKRFLHGEIVCDGNAALQSGRQVELRGVSQRLAGTYRVVDCRHAFNASDGFVTRLGVQRGDWQR